MKKIDVLFFLNMLLIGSDKLALSLGIINIRFVQISLLVTTIAYFLKQKFKFANLIYFMPFLISNIVSLFYSIDIVSGLGYIIWTMYNYVCVYCLFYSWTKQEEIAHTINMWFITFALQGVYIFIQFILGLVGIEDLFFGTNFFRGVPRPAIWFYEPSYLATYLSIYFSISVYVFLNNKDKKYQKHIIFSAICIALTTSTTGYIALALTLLLSLFFLKQRSVIKKYALWIKVLFTTLSLGALLYVIFPDIINVFIGRLFTQGILVSSGGRITGWRIAWQVFKENYLFGVGPSNYQAYLDVQSPPSNVTLEVLSNLGIFGLFTLAFFIGVIIFRGYIIFKKAGKNSIFKDDILMLKGFIFAFFIFLVVLQANQNYLRLYMWMHLGIISGVGRKISEDKNYLDRLSDFKKSC